MTTGDRMRARRKELGIPVEDIAGALGVSVATVYRYEKGDIEKLPGAVLDPLANILKTTPAYLMGWDEQKETPANPGERTVSDEDIKFALFGGKGVITDEMYDEVRSFAEYVRQREERKAGGTPIPRSLPVREYRVASPVMIPTARKKEEK